MSNTDNYNEYNNDQVLEEKHTRRKQYIIFRSVIWVWGLNQKSSYKVWIRGLIRSLDQKSESSQKSDVRRVDIEK